MSVIEFAEKHMHEEDAAGNVYLAAYWRAYLDGASAQKREDEKKAE